MKKKKKLNEWRGKGGLFFRVAPSVPGERKLNETITRICIIFHKNIDMTRHGCLCARMYRAGVKEG